jgi:CRP-like cAMP-binding protein
VAGQHGRVALALAEAEQRMRIDRERALAERYLYPIKARLAHALYRMSSRDPDALVRETREAIADDIGTSEDRVTKALHQLRAEGLVSFEDFQRSSLELVNRDRLRTYGRK